jgi:hypothetical protein
VCVSNQDKKRKEKQQMGCRKKELLLPNPWWQCRQNMIFTERSQNKKEGVMEVMLILERR